MRPSSEAGNLRSFGNRGESLAVQFLESLGYRILDRNVYTPYGELDCVAQDGETVVFVEVKTRRNDRFGSPQEAVTHRKRQRLYRSAWTYLQERNLADAPCRFDVIAIVTGAGAPQVTHLENAFTCEDLAEDGYDYR